MVRDDVHSHRILSNGDAPYMQVVNIDDVFVFLVVKRPNIFLQLFDVKSVWSCFHKHFHAAFSYWDCCDQHQNSKHIRANWVANPGFRAAVNDNSGYNDTDRLYAITNNVN